MSIFNDTEIEKIENRKKLRVGAFKDSVGVESETMDMWWLFELWNNGKVDSLETFLQRPILEKIWKANDNQKCLEFLTSALKGTSLLEGYILAPASLVLDECKKWEKHETDKDVLAQLKECKDLVQKKIAKGIEWFILDGQTRSKTTIVPFFKSALMLPQAGIKGDQVVLERNDNLKDVLVNGKTFDKLDKDTQNQIKATPVRIDVIVSGSLQGVVSSLIAKQLNVAWTDFQRLYIGSYISAFANRIISTMKPDNKDFLVTYTNINQTTNFKVIENGIEFFHALLLNYFQNGVVSKIGDIEFINRFKPGGNNITKSKCEALNLFYDEMIEWSGMVNVIKNLDKDLVAKGKVKLDIIRNYFIIRWAIFTKKSPMPLQSIPDIEILSSNGFVDWFVKKHLWLSEKYHTENGVDIINDKSWTLDPKTKKPMKTKSGYAQSMTSYTKDNFDKALAHLLPELEEDVEFLKREKIVRDKEDMDSKEQLLVSKGFKDRHGKDVSSKELFLNDYNRGHEEPQADKGSNKKLVIQEEKENKQYGKKPLIPIETAA